MNKLDDILFELLQVAIGNRRELTSQLTAEEWAQLRLEFKKQGMLGIGYCGITRLPQEQCPPIHILAQWVHNAEKIRKKNERLSAECASICETLEHDGIDSCIIKGQSNLVNYQTPNPLKGGSPDLADYRTPGDIDLWCKAYEGGIQIASGDGSHAEYETYKGISAIVEYAQQWRRLHDEKPIPWHRVLYYHVEISLPPTAADSQKGKDGTEVELHYRPSFLLNPIRNRRMQRWFIENEQFGMVRWGYKNHDHNQAKNPAENKGEDSFNGSSQTPQNPSKNPTKNQEENLSFPIPTNSFNAVYQLVHIYRHLFEEGIGLRQLLDYYFVLRSLHIEQGEHSDRTQSMAMWEEGLGNSVLSNTAIMYQLKRFGLDKFASAVMYVLQEAFNMPDVYLICKPNEKEGKWLLNEIMLAGNFGRSDERNEGKGHIRTKLSRALMLVKHYPCEALWQPYFMTYHWLWRRFEWWR